MEKKPVVGTFKSNITTEVIKNMWIVLARLWDEEHGTKTSIKVYQDGVEI